jgi:hypothetical protein
MSVHDLATPDDFTRDTIGPEAGMCFYCGEEVQRVAVVWKGHALSHEGMVALHPLCAQRLALHLAKDGINAEHSERTNGGR